MTYKEILKQYWGYDDFRGIQKEIIESIGNGHDTLGLMPTGGGKSITFQVPALAQPGLCLVITPLIALMKDQVRNLRDRGIKALAIYSGMTREEIIVALENCIFGDYKFLYISPERLDTEIFRSKLRNMKVSMITVDESHCISQWGHEFRPSYTKISDFIELLPYRPIVAAFTATATSLVKQDIAEKLKLHSPFELTTGFDRPNLHFAVYKPLSKESWILNYLERNSDESGIIYCSSRKIVERLCETLSENGIDALPYHAGMSDELRTKNQDDFIYDRVKIIVATSAFGMGINKPNVRFVIHYHMPRNIEQYYQEAGRAGRDGEKAECILLYSGSDVSLNKFMINKGSEENESLTPEERKAFLKEELEKLKIMTFYSTSKTVCLRKRMLNYFGEYAPQHCNNCSVCEDYANDDYSEIIKPTRKTESYTKEEVIPDKELFEHLKVLRKNIAMRQSVPAYVVFSDATLREMSGTKPRTEKEFLSINGIGDNKLKRYGSIFLAEIQKYIDKKGI